MARFLSHQFYFFTHFFILHSKKKPVERLWLWTLSSFSSCACLIKRPVRTVSCLWWTVCLSIRLTDAYLDPFSSVYSSVYFAYLSSDLEDLVDEINYHRCPTFGVIKQATLAEVGREWWRGEGGERGRGKGVWKVVEGDRSLDIANQKWW